MYLILGGANINYIVFLSFFCSLLVCKKVIDFCVLTLYIALISSRRFFCRFFFSAQMIMSSVNVISFMFSFLICVPFNSFFLFINRRIQIPYLQSEKRLTEKQGVNTVSPEPLFSKYSAAVVPTFYY